MNFSGQEWTLFGSGWTGKWVEKESESGVLGSIGQEMQTNFTPSFGQVPFYTAIFKADQTAVTQVQQKKKTRLIDWPGRKMEIHPLCNFSFCFYSGVQT